MPVDVKREVVDRHVFEGPLLDRTLTVLQSQAPALRDRGVLHAFVFGSVARREDGPDSDIDLVVEVRPGFGSFELMDVESFLTDAIGRRAEIVSRRGLLPDRHADIIRDMVRAF
jgi:predicted nucleotidyltransferase